MDPLRIIARGIVNKNTSTGKIINCYNKGKVYSYFHEGAGIAHTNEGLIVGGYNEGEVVSRLASRASGAICMKNTGVIISSYNVKKGNNCYWIRENTGTIIGCYELANGSNLIKTNSGTITNSYYYNNTAKAMYDVTNSEAITINEGETEQTALKRLLQAANDALSTDEDYETKKVTWKVDANINSGYPSFMWQNKSE